MIVNKKISLLLGGCLAITSLFFMCSMDKLWSSTWDEVSSVVFRTAQAAAEHNNSLPSASRNAALTVQVAHAQRLNWIVSLPASGSIFPREEVSIGTELSGLHIQKIFADVGDFVKKGQLLAQISDETLTAERDQVRASLAEVQASLVQAQANAQRAMSLRNTGAMSLQEIEKYTTEAQVAQARELVQRARLQSIDLKLKQTKVLAPCDGVISLKNIKLGGVVLSSTDLFRLIQKGKLEWRAEMIDNDLSKVRVHSKVKLHFPDRPVIAGTVRLISPVVDMRTRYGLVYVDLETSIPELRSGTFAKGMIETGYAPAIVLPQSAVLRKDGRDYLFQVGADSRVQKKLITTGRRLNDQIEVLAGISEDGRFVRSGGVFLSDGDLVRVVE